MLAKQDQLHALVEDVHTSHICSDLAVQATQLVVGRGNVNAPIVFIGEAPGKQEDMSGRPFVGASGKLLDELLASIQLTRDDVYITNIVKYRPPNNRDPKRDEIAAFLPFLYRELAIIQPRIIATLGRHSLHCFLPKAVIGQEHGVVRPIPLDGREYQLLPLYHPAAALYNGSQRQILFEDFQAIPPLLHAK